MITAIVFFVMITPITEQAKGAVSISDSSRALGIAESGLEIELLRAIANQIPKENLSEFRYSSSTFEKQIAITGKVRNIERTLFFEQ